MNNTVNFYNNTNKNEVFNQTGVYSNYEYEMISSVSNASENPFDAIEIIVDMAKTGKIDPWNIDIVKVYDEYMKKLQELNESNNLKFVGRAFVFASILLNLKSKVLSGISISDFEPEPDFDDTLDGSFDDGFGGYDGEQLQIPSSNIISFDEVLQRRTSTKLNRNRGVTLNDLIRHLEFYEQLEKKRALKNTLERQKRRLSKNYSKLSTTDILDMTQDEYIEDLVEKMEQNLNKILEREEKIEIRELTLLGFSRPAAYIAVLYLSAYGKFDIYQEEFYGDLFVTLPQKKMNNDANSELEKIIDTTTAQIVQTLNSKLKAASANAVGGEKYAG